MDMEDPGIKRAMVLIDLNLGKLSPVATVLESLKTHKVEHALFDKVRVEPTNKSFQDAIEFAKA